MSEQALIDAHVHHWDPPDPQRYSYLAPGFDLGRLGLRDADADAIRRPFGQADLLAEAADWNLRGYLHVSATDAPKGYLEETSRLAGLGGPLVGIIGGIDVSQSPDEVVADLRAQAAHALFRGIRIVPPPDFGSPSLHAALDFLAEEKYVYDLVVHPPVMAAAAAALRRHPTLTVVIEHLGWPLDLGTAQRAQWRSGLQELADLGPQVALKVSGIAMTAATFAVDVIGPWITEAVDIFGPSRCVLGSNFPIDNAYGHYADLMASYRQILGPYGPDALRAIFADNARAIYGLLR